MCGGRGLRISSLTSKYGCKSLIPINGIPAIKYVLKIVRTVTLETIFLCVDRKELIPFFEEIVDKSRLSNIEIYIDQGKGPMPTMYEIGQKFAKDRVLVLFGHHLVSRDHLERMFLMPRKAVVVSLYTSSSESHCKITKMDRKSRLRYIIRYNELVKLKKGERYVDLPYIIPKEFFSQSFGIASSLFPTIKKWFIKEPMPRTFLGENEIAFGLDASFPHEFHNLTDIPIVESYARKLAII
jgi:NDP-sugar pyrophosphorylase family protein